MVSMKKAESDLVTTGAAAQLLGSSRQHVVDLCDRGALRFVRVGSHRRIPREALEQVVRGTDPMLTRDQERSLWLHRAVVAALMADPEAVMAKGRANLDQWQTAHRSTGMTARWMQLWREKLDEGVDAVAEALSSDSRSAVELRQNSPFAGVVQPEVRLQVLKSFSRHWRRDHVGPSRRRAQVSA